MTSWRRQGTRDLCRPSDAAAMCDALRAVRRPTCIRRPLAPANRAVIERYEYGRLANEMAAFFERVLTSARP